LSNVAINSARAVRQQPSDPMADLRECIRNARANISASDAATDDKDRTDYAISAVENLIEAVEAIANAFDRLKDIDL
jgi:hypothetical protein